MTALPAGSVDDRVADEIAGLRLRLPFSHDEFGIFSVAGMLSDAAAVLTAGIVTSGAFHWISFGRAGPLDDGVALGAVLAIFTTVLMKLKGLYTPGALLSPRSHIASIIAVWSIAIVLLLGAGLSLDAGKVLSHGWIPSFAIAAPALLLSQRLLLQRMLAAALNRGWFQPRHILLITDAKVPPPSDEWQCPYQVLRMNVLPQNPDEIRNLLERVIGIVRSQNRISEVHIAIDWTLWSRAREAIGELRVLPMPVRLIADRNAREILRFRKEELCGVASFELQHAPLTPGQRAAKRLFDVVIAALAMLVLAPVFLAISLAIRIDSPGPIFFRQSRGGSNGRVFRILKFRTMLVVEDGPFVNQATRDDGRVTEIGRLLRRLSLDELPQLINVLRGDMSLVGPRPHALTHDDAYSTLISRYHFRRYVKPGMTGWAQVNGFRGETRTVALMKRRVDLDLWYVGNWSFWLDLRILLRTVREVCRSRTAF